MSIENHPPFPIARIVDEASGAEASLLPDFGFNCFSWKTPHTSAEGSVSLREALWAADDFTTGAARPSGSGIPLLFPFPGRIQGTEFPWEGSVYRLPEGDGRGNAIHGFVHERPWRVLHHAGNTITAQFQASHDDPTLLDHWPADFCITATYTIDGSSLHGEYLLENPDVKPLPCGFGTHPYFRLPLSENSRADECQIAVPATKHWELIGMNATGRTKPVANDAPLRRGLPFAQAAFDDVFGIDESSETANKANAPHWTATLTDAAAGRQLLVQASAWFRQCVIYVPGHREAICIEPYSCVPDVFRLVREGKAPAEAAGLTILAPGESIAVNMRLEWRRLG